MAVRRSDFSRFCYYAQLLVEYFYRNTTTRLLCLPFFML